MSNTRSIPAYALQSGDLLAVDDHVPHVVDWVSDEPRGVTRILVEVKGDIYERRFGIDNPEETVKVVA